jgi:DinB superfamily
MSVGRVAGERQRGRHRTLGGMTDDERQALLTRYATGADDVLEALADATDADLDRQPPSGWSARMVVHHLADSEAMAYIRLCRLVAEDDPVIQGYDEPEWARRLHYDRPIETSLAVLRAVRAASHELLGSLTDEEWQRTGTHSESGTCSVERWLGIYAKHSHEHADQIRRARRGED